jgi:hypothetical protein
MNLGKHPAQLLAGKEAPLLEVPAAPSASAREHQLSRRLAAEQAFTRRVGEALPQRDEDVSIERSERRPRSPR